MILKTNILILSYNFDKKNCCKPWQHYSCQMFVNETLNNTIHKYAQNSNRKNGWCIEWEYNYFSCLFYYLFLFISLFFSFEGEEKYKIINGNQEMENEFIVGRKRKCIEGQLLNKIKEIDLEFGHSEEYITRIFFKS